MRNADEFKKEDLAYALATLMTSDMVQTAHLRLETLTDNYKYVFFCGNYVNHPLMRTLVTREWLQRDLEQLTFMGADVRQLEKLRAFLRTQKKTSEVKKL